jgi:hypothetical protein
MSTNNITFDYHKCHHFQRAKLILIQGHFFIKIRWHQEIDFAGIALRFERLKISLEIKGN